MNWILVDISLVLPFFVFFSITRRYWARFWSYLLKYDISNNKLQYLERKSHQSQLVFMWVLYPRELEFGDIGFCRGGNRWTRENPSQHGENQQERLISFFFRYHRLPPPCCFCTFSIVNNMSVSFDTASQFGQSLLELDSSQSALNSQMHAQAKLLNEVSLKNDWIISWRVLLA